MPQSPRLPVKHYKLRFEQWVPVPIEPVFAFFTDPRNLPKIMPAWMQASVDSSSTGVITGVGAEVVVSYRILPGLPFRQRWVSRIVEFEPLHHFCDEQISGPFTYWRHCHYLSREDWDGRIGTRIVDELKYTLGYGPIGKIVDRLLVRPRLKANFDPRQEAIATLLLHP